MNTITYRLPEIVNETFTNESGYKLFLKIDSALSEGKKVLLSIESSMPVL